MTTAEERFEHMVAMAMQAWDLVYAASSWGRFWTIEAERRRFEAAVRERLAQSAQVYELEIGASERSR